MELLLLLLGVPVMWMLLAPARVIGRARGLPIFSTIIVGAIVIAGVFLFVWMGGKVPSADYQQGDVELRALLE
jgi:hypothetical protein